jgi:hypothetical protein
LSELQVELDSVKAVSPKREERPSCSWAGLAVASKEGASRGLSDLTGASYKATSHQIPIPQKVKLCQGRAVVGLPWLRSWRALWHIQMELDDRGAWNFKRIVWFCFACDDQWIF